MSQLEHFEYLLSQSRKVSTSLRNVLIAAGPVAIPPRRDPDLLTFLARSIVGQQLSAKAARSIWARVIAKSDDYQCPLDNLFQEAYISEIRSCGVSASKIKALLSVKTAAASGWLRDHELKNLTPGDRYARLSSIWGIGQWTCDMTELFYFQNADVWPTTDVAVQNNFKKLIGKRSSIRAANLLRPYRSHISLVMWQLADGTLKL